MLLQQLGIVFLAVVATAAGASIPSECAHCFVVGDESSSSAAENCSAGLQRFSDLQAALVAVTGLEAGPMSLPNGVRNCVSVSISEGLHEITAPVDLGNASVEFVGISSPPPTIRCNYMVNVDPKRIFDPSYSFVNFTLSFAGSERVSFAGVAFVGCPFPIRLETVRTVAILDSTFQ